MSHRRFLLSLRLLAAWCLGLALLALALLALDLTPPQTAEAARLPRSPGQSAPNRAVSDGEGKYNAMLADGISRPPVAVEPVQVVQASEPTAGLISGRVLANKEPVAGAQVTLRRYNSQFDLPVLSTTTTITGYYAFANPPSSAPDVIYYVRFESPGNQPYVSIWYGPDLPPYTAGTQVSGGDLEVADAPLVFPPDKAVVSFPLTFRWQKRVTTTDSYRWVIYNPRTDTYTATVELGHVDSVTIASPPPNVEVGKDHQWYLRIRDTSTPTSYGRTFRRTIWVTQATATIPPVTPTRTTAVPTGTPTEATTGTSTAPATATLTPMATGTSTRAATRTSTATAPPTLTPLPTTTSTPATTTTATGTATPTVTSTRTAAPPTSTPSATVTPVVCAPGSGGLCAGAIVIRAFIDFGCDSFFNRGTDYPLSGATMTATLPGGTRRTGIVDENGNALIAGVNLSPNDSVTLTADNPPPAPTWVQQSNYTLAPCGGAATTVSVSRASFGAFGVAFVDFRFSLAQR